jgi:hypothetical protein
MLEHELGSKVPHFEQRYEYGADGSHVRIYMGDQFIHAVENLEKFYGFFGFTNEMALAGKLPDEYIWETYVKGKPSDSKYCLQIHFINYLLNDSKEFREKYQEKCKEWIKAHVEKISAARVNCPACKMNPICAGYK